ncbi:hypothetical protein CR513_34492, partial [Mucuna pruriens]
MGMRDPSDRTSSSLEFTQKKVDRPKRVRDMTVRHIGDSLIVVEFDHLGNSKGVETNWQEFVQQHLASTIQEKRQKGRDIQGKNLYRHILSHGVAHHELWKRVQLKLSSNYTSNSSTKVAKKIRIFVPHGHENILTTTIGRLEHLDHVRTAKRSVGLHYS